MGGESFGVVLLPLALPIAAVGIPAALLLEKYLAHSSVNMSLGQLLEGVSA
ncbi:MAG: hypothetical protein DDT23_01252 [candidate division WS2 bacterium]|nr:hypothetical protein [Candidatus Lithacetigena glycinireducens]